MLSLGIRFGKGFDRETIWDLMEAIPVDDSYDLVVIGSSPGAVACVKEAASAGKKTVLVKWKNYSPAEEEGFDEDLRKMTQVLKVSTESQETLPDESFRQDAQSRHKSSTRTVSSNMSHSDLSNPSRILGRKAKWSRKIRTSRLDLSNELFKRGHQTRKLMHNAVILRDVVKDAQNCGWRTGALLQSPTLNWNKMSNKVMDYVMKENWELMNVLIDGNVEVLEGTPSFVDDHTISLTEADGNVREINTELICIAPSAEYVLPDDVIGAKEFGITCDDFIRMNEPPGETLIVGSTAEGIECAGIIACSQYPVTVVSRSSILKGYDMEMAALIMDDLKSKGVVFMENKVLMSIELTGNKLLAKIVSAASSGEGESDTSAKSQIEKQFDTVLFAVGKKLSVNFLELQKVGIELNPEHQTIYTSESECAKSPNIFAIGEIVADRPHGFEIDETAGTLLGRRLFHDRTENLDYAMMPVVMYTPTQYAFVGISEDAAVYRFGVEFINVHHDTFVPLDFVLPPKNSVCFAKVVVFSPTDLVIGIHLFGPDAGEIIQGFAVLIKQGITLSTLKTNVGVPGTKAKEILNLKKVKAYQVEDSDLPSV